MPYGVATVRLVASGDMEHDVPYFEEKKLVYEMYEKIAPYDENDTREINLINYHKDDDEKHRKRKRRNQDNRKKYIK